MRYLILSLMLCAACYGRIGENFEQCKKRYGVLRWRIPAPSKRIITYQFEKNDCQVNVTLIDGICKAITFKKYKNGPFTKIEARLILEPYGEFESAFPKSIKSGSGIKESIGGKFFLIQDKKSISISIMDYSIVESAIFEAERDKAKAAARFRQLEKERDRELDDILEDL